MQRAYPITCVCIWRLIFYFFSLSIRRHFKLFLHQTAIQHHNGPDSWFPNCILMRGRTECKETPLFFWGEGGGMRGAGGCRCSSSAPCSPRRDKQLTSGLTHSTLISSKYSTAPLCGAINLISDRISHLAIIFWTIKPISVWRAVSPQLCGTIWVTVW